MTVALRPVPPAPTPVSPAPSRSRRRRTSSRISPNSTAEAMIATIWMRLSISSPPRC